MTAKQKLKELIELAVSRGWKAPGLKFRIVSPDGNYFSSDSHYFEEAQKFISQVKQHTPEASLEFDYHGVGIETFLFSHDYAKAVYGEEDVPTEEMTVMIGLLPNSWQYHLMKQVLSEDPIDYMYDHRKI